MADKLIFPIGFDLEAAVKEAQGDAPKLLRRLQTTINSKPLAVNLKIPNAGTGSINEINARLKTIVKEWNNLTEAQRVTNKTTGEYTAEAKKLLAEYTRLVGASNSYARTLKQIDAEAKRAAKAQEKLANSTKKTSQEFQSQDGYISRLLKRMAVYAGYSAIGTFLTNVREVTAQFELQRVSLGAIIQDQQRANQLFAEIKSFALTSPLKILDLTKYTKQVAAYGFEANKLFDTTKMLADISVGLGVDMSRLTLFLGQVFATGYLRASEVRQATEAGIPLVDKLAKKLSEANGTLVTAADVMDLISKRAISFEQVEEVFKDMTSAGGEFYNMQVKQSQTLFGMWSKLGDAAALMYDQIGNTSSVNSAMKTTIGLLEKMMRNWQTTGTVLSSLAIGMGTYAIALRNASIASKALTLSEGARLAITKAQVITTPKLVAAIIGQNAATKLSTALTKAHTAAMLKQSVATNVLSRAFWGLSAAMLANPWAIALAAVVAAGYAIYQFTTRVETAADRTEKLNNAVVSLKNLDDTVKPLIDTYNELIGKTERTAAEEKKLSEVTHELAKRYPGAITAIGNFGNEVDLAADKLNKLYQAEKNARMENTRYELGKTEEKIKGTEAEIEKLQQQLSEGTKIVYKRLGDSGLRTKKIIPLTEEDKGKILKRIDELTFGEDGQDGLNAMKELVEATREELEAMTKGITVEALRVEKFGSWRKELQSFRTELEGGAKIQLFDDSTITQFQSLDDAMQAAAKTYKENTELVERYSNALLDMTASASSRADAEEALAKAQEEQNLALAALTRFGYKPSDFDKSKGRGTQSDQRLSILQEMVSTLKQVNKEYDELAKKEGNTKALADTQRVYADTFKNMQQLAAKYKFELPDFGVPTDTASLTRYLKAVKDAMAKLPKSDKAVLALQVDIEKLKTDELQKQIEQKLKELSDKISRTKTAKEFYDRILNTTGDIELAANISMSIYGDTGVELQQQMAQQIQEMFSGFDVEVPVSVISTDNQIDYLALEKFVDSMQDKLGGVESKTYQELKKIAQEGQRNLAKTYEGYLKDLEKAKSYSDKRIELARYTANKIAEIEASGYSKEEKKRLTAGYKEREDKEAAKLEYEAFKNSALYVQMFEDLDYASTNALTRMRDRLIALKSQWKNLDPTQLKELQSRLKEIDAQIAARNPFKALADAFKKYRDLRKSGRTKGGDELKADEAEKARKAAEEKMLADEAAYQALVKQFGAESDVAKEARKVAESSKEVYDAAEQTANETAEMANDWKVISELINNANQKIDEYQAKTNEALDGVRKMLVAFGTGDEDLQYFDDIVSSLNEIIDAGQQAATSVAAFMSGNILTGITSGVAAVGGLISGFSNLFAAGKVKKANKEIKRQQELLDQLEYTYGRLEKAAEKAFGADYLRNYNRQLKNLQAQAEAYQKQAAAERSKGKKADKDKIKEYENAWRDTMDAIAEMQGKLSEKMLGTDLASSARDFAKAWIEAYKEVGRAGAETSKAMKEKFQDMIENMVVEGALAAVMQKALQPMFDMIDNMSEQDFYSEAFWKKVAETAQQGAEDADKGAQTLMKFLEQAGISIKDINSEYTGIKRDIAGASEETMSNVATIGNTLMYYVSPIPGIAANVALLTQHILNGNASATTSTTAAGWTDWQQQAMDSYLAIQRNTAETVVECRRAAQAAETAVSQLQRVITIKGSKHGFQVYM